MDHCLAVAQFLRNGKVESFLLPKLKKLSLKKPVFRHYGCAFHLYVEKIVPLETRACSLQEFMVKLALSANKLDRTNFRVQIGLILVQLIQQAVECAAVYMETCKNVQVESLNPQPNPNPTIRLSLYAQEKETYSKNAEIYSKNAEIYSLIRDFIMTSEKAQIKLLDQNQVEPAQFMEDVDHMISNWFDMVYDKLVRQKSTKIDHDVLDIAFHSTVIDITDDNFYTGKPFYVDEEKWQSSKEEVGIFPKILLKKGQRLGPYSGHLYPSTVELHKAEKADPRIMDYAVGINSEKDTDELLVQKTLAPIPNFDKKNLPWTNYINDGQGDMNLRIPNNCYFEWDGTIVVEKDIPANNELLISYGTMYWAHKNPHYMKYNETELETVDKKDVLDFFQFRIYEMDESAQMIETRLVIEKDDLKPLQKLIDEFTPAPTSFAQIGCSVLFIDGIEASRDFSAEIVQLLIFYINQRNADPNPLRGVATTGIHWSRDNLTNLQACIKGSNLIDFKIDGVENAPTRVKSAVTENRKKIVKAFKHSDKNARRRYLRTCIRVDSNFEWDINEAQEQDLRKLLN